VGMSAFYRAEHMSMDAVLEPMRDRFPHYCPNTSLHNSIRMEQPEPF
jgi:hypothetical protein